MTNKTITNNADPAIIDANKLCEMIIFPELLYVAATFVSAEISVLLLYVFDSDVDNG